MPVDLQSIMVSFSLYPPSHAQYKDKRQELLEALEWDPEEREDKDDKENWELSSSTQLLFDLDLPSPSSRRRSPTSSSANGGNSGNSSSAGSEGRERKVPRLSLDDALIMVVSTFPCFQARQSPHTLPRRNAPFSRIVQFPGFPSASETPSRGGGKRRRRIQRLRTAEKALLDPKSRFFWTSDA